MDQNKGNAKTQFERTAVRTELSDFQIRKDAMKQIGSSSFKRPFPRLR